MASELFFQPIGTQIKVKDGLERVADVDPRLTRSYYFDSRLLTAEDLTRDQLYLDGRLREVGQALGYGILRGLETSLSDLDGVITVKVGAGVTRAGRVLELTRELSIDVGDRATLFELNNGKNSYLDRALYVVIVRYAEVGTDVAEAFPTDLGSDKNFQYDVISEGVQLALVRLPQPLGQQSPVSIRANLLREWLGDNTAGGAVPEDAVALAVLAVSNGRPQWLDAELLRQPLRSYNKPGDLQQDLARRYENIFQDLLVERAFSTEDFAAADYFRLLPPVGSLPKSAINPVTGRQGYFPENFSIWIAPVRVSDIELLRAESMSLPPIDLNAGEPIDIIVLAPLSNALYGQFAQRLERPTSATGIKLIPSQDLLRLRLYPQRPVHELDTDRNTWQDIWDRIGNGDLFYIRRPLRAAETRLSGIVLAQGVPVPTPPAVVVPTPADGGLLQNEDSVFLNRINLKQLAQLRPATAAEGEEALKNLVEGLGSDAVATQLIANLLVKIERGFDEVTWQTLLAVAKAGTLEKFSQRLNDPEFAKTPTAQIVVKIAEDFSLPDNVIETWKKFASA
ncbi:MAG TPA: hypothetical protein VN030_03260 [Cellvibrio sp.]|nr:hypothetical protein [Cellvibrio sp.]